MRANSGVRDVRPHRLARRSRAIVPVAVLAVLLVSGCQVPLGPVTKLASITNVRFPEMSDPFVVQYGGEYFMYGSNNDRRAPITRVTDLNRGYSPNDKHSLTVEGMPAKPLWARSATQLWAPTVAQFGTRWVMFFSADRVDPPDPANPQCIGRASAASPAGPFEPEPWPIQCGEGGHGALDPELFTDHEGRRWLLAAFGNTNTPIQAIALDSNANLVDFAKPILGRNYPWEYHFIENPSMAYDPVAGNYLLTYSAGLWYEPAYSTGIARCTTPTGPCVGDPSGPWIASSNGRSAPGGLSLFLDAAGNLRAIFSTFAAGAETTSGGRSASTMYVSLEPSLSAVAG